MDGAVLEGWEGRSLAEGVFFLVFGNKVCGGSVRWGCVGGG